MGVTGTFWAGPASVTVEDGPEGSVTLHSPQHTDATVERMVSPVTTLMSDHVAALVAKHVHHNTRPAGELGGGWESTTTPHESHTNDTATPSASTVNAARNPHLFLISCRHAERGKERAKLPTAHVRSGTDNGTPKELKVANNRHESLTSVKPSPRGTVRNALCDGTHKFKHS